MDRLCFARMSFRRDLAEEECARLRASFVAQWGEWYGGAVKGSVSQPFITLHTDLMESPGAYGVLRAVLTELGVSRVLQMREFGLCHEIELADAEFDYDGEEGWWTSHGLAWMVYASHESSITFGGLPLIDALRTRLPDFHKYLYRGWDPKLYL